MSHRFRAVPGVALLCAALLAPLEVSGADPAASGVHTVILIRHGAYDEADLADPEVGRGLVPLGRRQAQLVGRRLAALPRRPDGLSSSTMTRAWQTAEIIGQELGRVPELSRDLRECTPPYRGDRGDADDAVEAASCRARLDAVHGRLLVPTPADRLDVVVAHGNVIRHLVARSLGLDAEGWIGFGVTHTGMTVIEIKAGGEQKVVSFNDVGHLPAELQSRGGTRPQPPGGVAPVESPGPAASPAPAMR